jgi:hypothetical protein
LGNLNHADKPDNFEISSDQWLDYFKDINKKPIRHSLDIFNKFALKNDPLITGSLLNL